MQYLNHISKKNKISANVLVESIESYLYLDILD